VTPPWLEPLPDAAQQREIDRWAIEDLGIDDLMEHAGAGLATVTAQIAPAGRVVVACGTGNNGGDGRVAARLLRAQGRDVDVVEHPFDLARLDGAAVVVDALLGTGFEGTPRPPLDDVIRAINACGAPVVACDMPSGVDGSTGEVAGEAVRATATATFHAAKPGLYVHPGKAHAGAVHVIPIGIPDGAPVAPRAWLVGDGVLRGLPGRSADSTKFSSGTVVVVGGSPGLTGAPALAAAAAQRAGAGYVTIASDADVPHRPVEVMQRGLDGLDVLLAKASAVVLGPGLGPGGAELARDLYARTEVPLVLDADGLNAFAGHAFPDRGAPAILTPHAGELARLIDTDVKARRLGSARAAARHARAIVVLKGDDTLIATPAGEVLVSPGGAPALATAGTGDVLAGVIAALLARGVEPERAAAAGVLAHVRAGRAAAAPHGPDAVIASDVVAALPAALVP
jgi:ADP-dependent NAD(P)H-hydrate dehydratase / NAD(P)H-hydrate epimerase